MTAAKRDQLMKSDLVQARMRTALVNVANVKATKQPTTDVEALVWPMRKALAREIMQGPGAAQHWLNAMFYGLLVELDKSEYANVAKQIDKDDPDDDGKAVASGLTDAQEKELAEALESAFMSIFDSYVHMAVAR